MHGVDVGRPTFGLRYLSPASAVLSAAQEASGKALLRALGLFDELETPMEANRGSRELRNQVALLSLDAFQAGEISRGRLLDLGRLIGIDGTMLLQLAEAAEVEGQPKGVILQKCNMASMRDNDAAG